MKPNHLWVIGILFAVVLSFALVPFGPGAAEAQERGPAGAYAELTTATNTPGEIYTTFVLHADNTFTIIDSRATQQVMFVGTWRQVDGLIVEGTVIGVNIPADETPQPAQQPQLDINERDYSIVFESPSLDTATVTSTRGPVDSFTAQRIAVAIQLPPPQ